MLILVLQFESGGFCFESLELLFGMNFVTFYISGAIGFGFFNAFFGEDCIHVGCFYVR